MEFLNFILNFILHLDEHLIAFVNNYGTWTYFLLFLIIFCETGIIFTAILPGDSLLFAAGALCANVSDILNVHILFGLLFVASVAGNGLNYFIGKWLGPKVFRSRRSWLFNPKHLDRAHQFFEKIRRKNYHYRAFSSNYSNLCTFCCRLRLYDLSAIFRL